MQLRIGYELRYHFPQPTPVIMMLNVHDTRIPDLDRPDAIVLEPSVPISGYRDVFGNQCSRILAPAGAMSISTDTVVRDTGLPDPSAPDAAQVPIQDLPDDTLTFLTPKLKTDLHLSDTLAAGAGLCDSMGST